MPPIATLAHAVLLPAIDDLEPAPLRPLFARGCRSALLGETRAEYLARAMSDTRRARETLEAVRDFVRVLQDAAAEPVVVAADYELVGIRRFDHLIPISPSGDVAAYARELGTALAGLGVNVALGPILDVVRGANPWLEGRNLGQDADVVATLGAAMIEGLQASGVSAVAKHYPGHAVVPDDPAVAPARLETELEDADAAPFEAAVAAGVRGIMLGPAVVDRLDPDAPASLSRAVVRRAREHLGFRGVLVSDDLDAVSIRRDASIGAAAVAAIAAGVDLLLVGADAAGECAEALQRGVAAGQLSTERLSEAAGRVAALAAASAQLRPAI